MFARNHGHVTMWAACEQRQRSNAYFEISSNALAFCVVATTSEIFRFFESLPLPNVFYIYIFGDSCRCENAHNDVITAAADAVRCHCSLLHDMMNVKLQTSGNIFFPPPSQMYKIPAQKWETKKNQRQNFKYLLLNWNRRRRRQRLLVDCRRIELIKWFSLALV